MEVFRLDPRLTQPIGARPYDVRATSSLTLAEGNGAAHAYLLHFEPGGHIGPHEAGFASSWSLSPATGGSPAATASDTPWPRDRQPSSRVARCTPRAARRA